MDRRLLTVTLLLSLGLLPSLQADTISYAKLNSVGDFAGATIGYDSVFKLYGSYTPITWTAAIQGTNTVMGSATPTDRSTPVQDTWSVTRTGNSIMWSFGGASVSYNWAPVGAIDEILVRVYALDQGAGQTQSASVSSFKLNGTNLSIASNILPSAMDGQAFMSMNHFSVTDFNLRGNVQFAWAGGAPLANNLGIEIDFLRADPYYCAAPEPSSALLMGLGMLALGVTWGLRGRLKARLAR